MNQNVIEETQEINENGEIVITRTIYVKKPLSESKKAANKKWMDAHPEKKNEYARNNYKKRVSTDPDYLEKMRIKNRESYIRRKLRERENALINN